MLRRRLLVILFCLGLVGCSGYTPPRFEPALYPNSHAAYDLTLFWRLDRTGNGFTVAGFVKNTLYAEIKGLEVTATLLDDSGKRLGEDTFLFFPRQIAMDDFVPFTLNIPIKAGTQPATIRFFYRYRVTEERFGGSPYSQTFDVKLR